MMVESHVAAWVTKVDCFMEMKCVVLHVYLVNSYAMCMQFVSSREGANESVWPTTVYRCDG